jgi:hypothetical protein
MKKSIIGIIVVSMIICLTQVSCTMADVKPYLKVVNKHNLPITGIHITFIENVFPPHNEYGIINLNIPKGKSETFSLEHYDRPYNAEVFVFFGDLHSYKELRFVTGETTTATLNINGILE